MGKKKQELDYISQMILDSYKVNIKNESYIKSMEAELQQNKNKLDGLYCVFNMDEKNRRTFSQKIGINYEDLAPFLRVLQKV